MNYRPELDGLRALAVLPVIGFHAALPGFSGGFVGVDVFFVISGYLIATLIRLEMQAGTFSFARFYERRARRILPLLFLVMVACIPFAWFWMMGAQFRSFGNSIVAVLLFVSNLFFWSEAGYFDIASEEKPLLHTWSLGVEEQFYLLFPLFLLLLLRFRTRSFWLVLLSVFGLSLWLAHRGYQSLGDSVFFLSPMRVWELLAGVICAFLPPPIKKDWRGDVAAMAGLGFIAVAIVTFGPETPSPSLYTLLPVAGASLVVRYAEAGRAAGYLLASRPLVGLGLVSYGTYLWHQPLFAFVRMESDAPPALGVMVALGLFAIVLAAISWQWVERPLRDANRVPWRPFLWGVGLTALALLCFALIAGSKGGFADRMPIPPNVRWASMSEKVQAQGDICGLQPVAGSSGLSQCAFGDLKSARTIAIFGDSHARMLLPELDRLFQARGIRGLRFQSDGCEVVPDVVRLGPSSAPPPAECLKRIAALKSALGNRVEKLILVSRWTFRLYPLEGEPVSLNFRNPLGQDERVSYREYGAMVKGLPDPRPAAKRAALTRFVNDLAGVVPVLLVYPVPEAGYDIYKVNVRQYAKIGRVPGQLAYPRAAYDRRNRFVRSAFDRIAEHNPSIIPFYPDAILCEQMIPGACVSQWQGRPLYLDFDHLDDSGAKLLVEGMAPLL